MRREATPLLPLAFAYYSPGAALFRLNWGLLRSVPVLTLKNDGRLPPCFESRIGWIDFALNYFFSRVRGPYASVGAYSAVALSVTMPLPGVFGLIGSQ